MYVCGGVVYVLPLHTIVDREENAVVLGLLFIPVSHTSTPRHSAALALH